MHIYIELEVDDDLLEADGSGLSEPGYISLVEALSDLGDVLNIVQMAES